jgi:hypothetical protein
MGGGGGGLQSIRIVEKSTLGQEDIKCAKRMSVNIPKSGSRDAGLGGALLGYCVVNDKSSLGYCVVNDESHVGLVDPHAEGHGRHDYL